MSKTTDTQWLKEYAKKIGFDAVGICPTERLDTIEKYLLRYIQDCGDLDYMRRNTDKRLDSSILFPGARSMLVVLLNYWREEKDTPPLGLSLLSRSLDYHNIVKDKLKRVEEALKTRYPQALTRCFVDTAPLMEKERAHRAGLGIIGKNTLLIHPEMGSYTVIGVLLTSLDLDFDKALENFSPCQNCEACVKACPTGALDKPYQLNVEKCLAYRSIEYKGDKMPAAYLKYTKSAAFGCDICLQACTYNKKHKKQTKHAEFETLEIFRSMDMQNLKNMKEDDFKHKLKKTSLQRGGLQRIKRNIGLVLLFCILSSSFLSAQKSDSWFYMPPYSHSEKGFSGGGRVGLGASQVDGDEYSGYHKFSADLGFLVNYRFGKYAILQAELIYAHKGSVKNPDNVSGNMSTYSLSLHYLEIPLLFRSNVWQRLYVEAGPNFGFFIGGSEKVESYEIEGRGFRKFHLSSVVGVGANVSKNMNLGFRWVDSLMDIRKAITSSYLRDYRQYNNVLLVYVEYVF